MVLCPPSLSAGVQHTVAVSRECVLLSTSLAYPHLIQDPLQRPSTRLSLHATIMEAGYSRRGQSFAVRNGWARFSERGGVYAVHCLFPGCRKECRITRALSTSNINWHLRRAHQIDANSGVNQDALPLITTIPMEINTITPTHSSNTARRRGFAWRKGWARFSQFSDRDVGYVVHCLYPGCRNMYFSARPPSACLINRHLLRDHLIDANSGVNQAVLSDSQGIRLDP